MAAASLPVGPLAPAAGKPEVSRLSMALGSGIGADEVAYDQRDPAGLPPARRRVLGRGEGTRGERHDVAAGLVEADRALDQLLQRLDLANVARPAFRIAEGDGDAQPFDRTGLRAGHRNL